MNTTNSLYPDIESMFVDGVFSSALFDNIKAKFKVKHKPKGEVLAYTNTKGKPTSRTKVKCHNRHRNASLVARSSVDGEYLVIDGSYVKYLTGQNVIGLEDLLKLCLKVFKKVCRSQKIKPTKKEIARVRAGEFDLLRVDYTIHCDAGNEQRAVFFQQKIKEAWAFSQDNYSHYKDHETLYVNQSGDRWTFKSYLKGREVTAKNSLDGVLYGDQILNVSRKLIRLEVTFRSKWLSENRSPRLNLKYRNPLAWTQDEARRLMQGKIKELLSDIDGAYPSNKKLAKLSPNHKVIVNSIMNNVPVDSILNNVSFNRYRNIILKDSNIDIRLKRQLQKIGVNFKNAKQLIDTRIKYHSDESLFLELCKAEPLPESQETSNISDLMG